MCEVVIEELENNEIYTLTISFLTVNQLFHILFEMVTFYPTEDKNECTNFAYVEFCFLIFWKEQGTMQSKHNQNGVVSRRCKATYKQCISDAYCC